MSHQLELRKDGTASMFSGEGITPWHGLGKVVEGLATADEALKLAGLDWQVSKEPVYQKMGEDFKTVPDRFLTVRDLDQRPLGIVSSNYHIFQNTEAFDFLDTITDTGSGAAKYSTAGSLFDGRRVFLTLKIGDTFMVGDQDAHDMYLMVTNSHDGTQAFSAAVTTIRAVCNNTVTMALREAKSKWTLRHKTELSGKIEDARQALKMSWNYADAFQDEVDRLMEIEMTKDKFNKIIERAVPESKFQHDKDVAAIMDVFEYEPTVQVGGGEGTGWGAYNAVTYFTDNVRSYRTPEARFKSILGTEAQQGFAESLRNRTRQEILALA